MKSAQLIFRLLQSINKKGLRNTLRTAYFYIDDHLFDLIHGTDTATHVSLKELSTEIDSEGHFYGYQPTRTGALARLLKELSLPRHYGFTDLGSGKGRVLMLAARFHYKTVRGVEFSNSLCSISEKNIEKFTNSSTSSSKIEIHNVDVSKYQIKEDENIFFMFNPFGDDIIKNVLANIETSLKNTPRPIYIIYNNPVHSRAFEQASFLPYLKKVTISTSRFLIYSNTKSTSNALSE